MIVKRKNVLLKSKKNIHNLYLNGKKIKTIQKNEFNFKDEKLAIILKYEIENNLEFNKQIYFNIFSFAIDKIMNNKNKFVNEICNFAETDLICYRALSPIQLVELQKKEWNPVLKNLEAFNLKFILFEGIMPKSQNKQSIKRLNKIISILDNIQISCLLRLTKITGSALLSFSLFKNMIDIEKLYNCCFLDQIWQSKQWGMLDEIQNRINQDFNEIKKINILFKMIEKINEEPRIH